MPTILTKSCLGFVKGGVKQGAHKYGACQPQSVPSENERCKGGVRRGKGNQGGRTFDHAGKGQRHVQRVNMIE